LPKLCLTIKQEYIKIKYDYKKTSFVYDKFYENKKG